jgi:hypothetical protein
MATQCGEKAPWTDGVDLLLPFWKAISVTQNFLFNKLLMVGKVPKLGTSVLIAMVLPGPHLD